MESEVGVWSDAAAAVAMAAFIGLDSVLSDDGGYDVAFKLAASVSLSDARCGVWIELVDEAAGAAGAGPVASAANADADGI